MTVTAQGRTAHRRSALSLQDGISFPKASEASF